MIDQQHSTAGSNLAAIDIGKDWHVALVQDTSGQRHRFKFANRGADHDRFVQFLHSLSGPVRIGLEPTGDYHRPIAHRLLQEGFEVASISSLALARFREARFGTWDKNDPKDAQVILAMMEQGMVQVYWDPLLSGVHDWQELSNTYFHVTLARTRLQHSLLLHHLPLYFPEFTRYWHSARATWFIHFLQRFPIPANPKELELANLLVRALEAEFDPQKFRDTYRERLEKLIAAKVAGQATVSVQAPAPTKAAVDIMEALRKSLAGLKKPPEAAPARTSQARRKRG